jgi:hypothetical protein
MSSINKLLGVIPAGEQGDIWASLEAHKGALYITFREQPKDRWQKRRHPKPPFSIRCSNFAALRSVIDAAEAELQRRGFLKRSGVSA